MELQLNSKIIPSLNSQKPENHSNFDQPESIYSLNFRKSKVYIRFLQQTDSYTDDGLSACRVDLNTLLIWLGDCSLSDIQLKSPTFLCYLNQMNINNYEKIQIIINCQKFLLWAISIYKNEFS